MKKILLSGCNGQMGQVLQKKINDSTELKVVAGIDRKQKNDSSFPIYLSAKDVKEPVDVVIDFSHDSAISDLIHFCLDKKLPVVVATTGLQEKTRALLEEASHLIPVFYSANMSLGINVLIKALQKITPVLEADFDIEIIEKHHNQKKDAPSGTALLLADSINESCQSKKEYVYGRSGTELENNRRQLGIHAVRGGTIPGEHTVLYAGADELIEIKHTALSRDIFANGDLKAALILSEKPSGFYDMSKLIDQQEE